MSHSLNRRKFLHGAVAAGAAATLWAPGARRARAAAGPNEKLNIGIIGTANRAADNIDGVAGENIVAICDVDERYLGKAAERFPKAKTYDDFRKLLERKDLDAVVVSTADHTHAPAAAGALRSGKHVYCEKPLAHTVHEARVLGRLAVETKLATQMGTQIHAGDNYRRVVELVRAGAVGPIREVHVWLGNKVWSGDKAHAASSAVPAFLKYDLWLGPSPERPYNPEFHPASWRGWWDFGNGTLGDMGCHYIDLPFWALDLRHPTTVAAEGPPVDPDVAPKKLSVRYEFPARGDQPPVALTWYDGGQRPPILTEKKVEGWGSGVLFVGTKGMLIADYGNHALLPEADFRDFKAPEPSIPSSTGHYAEWITACKTGSPTTCNFNYSGALTEAVLLGNVSYRSGHKLKWNAEELRAEGCPEADEFLRREYRKGWAL